MQSHSPQRTHENSLVLLCSRETWLPHKGMFQSPPVDIEAQEFISQTPLHRQPNSNKGFPWSKQFDAMEWVNLARSHLQRGATGQLLQPDDLV